MAEARVVRPDRRQLRWDRIDLEGLLPAEHRARIVWSFVESLDLSQLYDQVLSQVLAREGEAGRPAADPAVLLSLWLYATVEGVGSARELERLAQSDAAYRWLAGGVPLNYHGLADFRVGQAEILDRLLTQSVTALIAEGLISLAEIAVDGTKSSRQRQQGVVQDGRKTHQDRSRGRRAVGRPQAGAGKRSWGLEPPGPSGARPCGARGSGARGKSAGGARTARGGAQGARQDPRPEDEAKKKAAQGFDERSRGALHALSRRRRSPRLQCSRNAAAPKEGVIVSIEVTDRRNDAGLAGPMVDDIVRRYGRTPDRLLVDTSYATSEDIVALAAHAAGPVSVYTPPPNEKETVKPASLARRRSQAREGARLPQGVAGAHGERSGPGRLCFAPAHRADQRRPQEPWLRFSCRARAHQGQGSRALACAREQSPRRSPSEDRNPMRRSQTSSPFSLSPPEPPSPQGERQGLEVEETPWDRLQTQKMRFLHTLRWRGYRHALQGRRKHLEPGRGQARQALHGRRGEAQVTALDRSVSFPRTRESNGAHRTMSLFRAVAWDIDGTLIDSEPLHQRGLVVASAALGVDLSDVEPEAFRGVHAIDIWKALKPRFPAGSLFKHMDRGNRGLLCRSCRRARAQSGRPRGDARACHTRSGASLRVEFRAHDRRRQYRGAGNRRGHHVLAEPRRRVVGQARSRALSRSRAPLRPASRRRSSRSRTAARAPVQRARRGSMWSAIPRPTRPSSAPTARS